MKLSKSIQELDSIAEALLKSVDNEQELTPDDIAKAPSKSSNEPSDDPEKEDPEDSKATEDTPEKSDGGEPTKKSMKKSEEDSEEEDEVVEKSMKKSAKKSMKKSEEDEDDESVEDDADEDEDGDEEDNKEDDLEKSLKTQFINEANTGNSEFLEAIVNVLSKSLAENVYNLQTLSGNTQASTDVLAKSLQANLGLNKSLQATVNELKRENIELKKSIAEGFSSLQDSLDSALSQPSRMRKSLATNVAVNDKDFTHSLSGQYSPSDSLSKSQVMGILNSELFSGNPMITAQDVISYESGAPLREEVRNLVINKCK